MPGKSAFALRPAGLEDGGALDKLLFASYGDLLKGWYAEDLLAKALPLMTRSNPRLLESGTDYVAVQNDGRLIGCGGWTFERPGTGEIARPASRTSGMWPRTPTQRAWVSGAPSSPDASPRHMRMARKPWSAIPHSPPKHSINPRALKPSGPFQSHSRVTFSSHQS